MANTKISALGAVATPASTDEFAVNQGGTTKKETRAQIHTLESGETLDTTAGTATLGSVTATGVTIDVAADAVLTLNANTAADADPRLLFKINDANKFSLGVDDSQSDTFKITLGSGMGSASAIEITSSGNITVAQNLAISGAVVQSTVTTLADEDTPTVAAGNLFKTGGTTIITDFDDGVVGQTIQILAAHSVTITDGAPILLAGGNYGMTDSDTLTLTMFNDQVWVEVARSVN